MYRHNEKWQEHQAQERQLIRNRKNSAIHVWFLMRGVA
jgi:hypothetical protein